MLPKNNLTPSKNFINVLSLFDGVATGFVALKRAGFEIKSYKSSEIDKNCIKVQNHHYGNEENFIQLGDICGINLDDIIGTDLILISSPCTSLSTVNQHTPKLGLDGPESGLFFEAIRILRELKKYQSKKPIYFICENVGSMSNKNRDRMSEALKELFPETQLLKYDSSSVSASRRYRYYWTNIPNQTPLLPKNIKLSDIIENGYVDREKARVLLGSNVTLSNGIQRVYTRQIGNIVFKEKWFAELPSEEKLKLYPQILKDSGYDGKVKKDANLLDFPNGCYRLLTPLEAERCLGFDDFYISGVPNISKTEKIKMVGLSYTPDVIAHIASPLKSILNIE